MNVGFTELETPGKSVGCGVRPFDNLLIVLFCLVACCVPVQIAIGSDFFVVVSLFGAIVCGLFASYILRFVASIVSILTLIHVFKVVLFAFILKTTLGEPLEQNLNAPNDTALMLLMGYAAMLVSSLCIVVVVRVTGCGRMGLISRMSLNHPLWFAMMGILCFAIGLGLSFIDVGNSSGTGWLKMLASLRSLSVPFLIYYAHRANKRNIILNAPVVFVAGSLTLLGVVGGSKQMMMESWLFAGLSYYQLRGFQLKRAIVVVSGALLIIHFVVYPFSQVSKSAVVNSKGQLSVLERVGEFCETVLNPSKYEELIKQKQIIFQAIGWSYYTVDVGIFSRFSLIYEASWLVAASRDPGTRTGWYTIVWDLKMMVPSFLINDKPLQSPAPYLGSISGMTAKDDDETSVAFGYMAELYHAFGLPGVFLGGIVLNLIFLLVVLLFFGGDSCGAFSWVICVGLYHHTFAEGVISSILTSLYLPFVVVFYCCVAGVLTRLFVNRGVVSKRV